MKTYFLMEENEILGKYVNNTKLVGNLFSFLFEDKLICKMPEIAQ